MAARSYLIISTQDNWSKALEKKIFGSEKKTKILEGLKEGDKFAVYITGSKLFAAVGEIKSDVFHSNDPIWEDRDYPERFKFKISSKSKANFPAELIIKDLGFITEKQNWGIHLQGGLREIPLNDYKLIEKYLLSDKERKARTPTFLGNNFHDNIEKMLKNCGFEILESDYNKPGADIVIGLEHVKIIVQCKKRQEGEGKFKGLVDLVDSYATKVKREKADAAIIVISDYKLPKREDGDSHTEKVMVWDDSDIDYYSNLSEKIKECTAFQIVADLNINKEYAEPKELTAIPIHQQNSLFYISKASPEWLIKTAFVVRRYHTQKTQNYQRLLDKNRVLRRIPDYLIDDGGLFPNSLMLVSKKALDFDNNKLTLPSCYGNLWVMDGQHRLYGFANVPDTIKTKFEIPIVIFDGKKMSAARQADIFVSINDNAKKVAKSLLLELQDSFGLEVQMGVKLAQKLRTISPFKDRIRMYAEKKNNLNTINFVTFATNQSIQAILNDSRLYGKHVKSEEAKLKIAYQVVSSFYSEFHKKFSEQWDRPEEFIFSNDKGIRALSQLLRMYLDYSNWTLQKTKLSALINALFLKRDSLICTTADTKNKFAGEAGARDLAILWAKSIQTNLPDFSSVIPDLVDKIVSEREIYRGNDILVKQTLKDWMSGFSEEVFGELDYGDATTIGLLRDLLPNNVKNIRLIIDVIEPQHQTAFKEAIRNANLAKGLNIKVITTSRGRQIDGRDILVPISHGRWISDGKYRIDLETDLKRDSLASRNHRKTFVKLASDERFAQFDQTWNALKAHTGATVQVYE